MRKYIDRPGRCLAALVILVFLLGNRIDAQSPTIDPPRDWATTMGGVNFDFITDAVTDGQGGLYVTGYTNSPNFPTTLPGSPGAGYDVFVARVDSFGAVTWSTRFGGSGTDYGNAIARDPSGNLLVAGRLGGHGTFVTDSTYKGTGDDILVLKLTAAGSLIAAMRYGGAAADEAVGIAAGANDQMVVVGNSSSSDIATTSALYNGTSGDAFVLRLRSNLSRHLAFRYGGNSFDKANDVVIDPQGDFYVAGETGSANYPQTIATYQGSGGAKAFVMRFDSLGARIWAQRYGGNAIERAYALDLPANGGLLMAGYTSSTNFPSTIPGLGGAGLDAFLVHLNLDGTRDYARRLGGTLDDLCLDIATDALGNIFMAGETQSLNFPSTNDRHKGQGRDQFMAKFGPTGGYEWSFPFGGTQNDFSGGALASTAASVYLAGHTQSLNFPQTLTGTGGNTARGSVLRLRDCIGQVANFSFQDVCEFDTVFFQNLSLKGSSDTLAYRWWFGDGDSSDVVQPWHSYATPGAYQVTLRVTSPCGVDSLITKTVNTYPAPRADWGHDLSCATRFTAFQDSTVQDTVVGSYEDDWRWYFGTGDSSTLQNPSYVYANPGSYTVTFTVASNHGCSDSHTDTVVVHHRPYANMTLGDVCLRDTAHFADATVISGDSLTTWAWDFGDNGNSTAQNPGYAYMAADTYLVQMIVNSDEGCADTTTQSIKVLPLPNVHFGMTEVCWPDTVAYTDSSSIAGDLIAGYAWHFGDALTDTLQNTWHSYAASGNYDVVLWVFTASGCADSLLLPLNVHDKPTADIGFQNVCFPEMTQFSDLTALQGDSLVAWNWGFGDGGIDSITDPGHTYALADTYSVRLAVVSSFGCRDTTWEDVIVYPKPTAYFAPATACEPLPVTLQDGSSVLGDVITGWNWDFGDGGTGVLPVTTHFYSNPGTYLVTLIATTASGCKDTIQDAVSSFPQPVAAYLVENVCAGDTMYFTDNSSLSGGSIAQYAYTFGDGNGANTPDVGYVYAQPGTYLISYTVTSDQNCVAFTGGFVTVYDLPDPQPAVLGYADICMGDSVIVQESQQFDHYQWETGDTTNAITVQGYSDWIVLTVVDGNTCENSDSVEVRYHPVPAPEAVIIPGPTVQGCSNVPLTLTAGGSYASYNWSDGNTGNPRLVTQSGQYAVLVFNGFGCADTSENVSVTIFNAPPSPVIVQNGNDLSVGTASGYQWYFNGLAIPNATAQSHTAMGTGDYAVMITDANGCTATSSTVSLAVGVSNAFVADLTVYPHPFSTETHLAGNLKRGGMLQIRLLNTIGQVVLEESVSVSAGLFQLDLPLGHLPTGYYLCELQLGRDRMIRSLVKQ